MSKIWRCIKAGAGALDLYTVVVYLWLIPMIITMVIALLTNSFILAMMCLGSLFVGALGLFFWMAWLQFKDTDVYRAMCDAWREDV